MSDASPIDRDAELAAAVTAVRAASRVCRKVQERLVDGHTLEKRDRSPVTVADFASQALVCAHLEQVLPDDPVVGEEDAHELREDAQARLRAAVVEHVAGELGEPGNESRVLAWIDRGGADARGRRYWTLDPIDGTKGFLRGEQYAVALALVEDGRVELAVLGCPNLTPSSGRGRGALFTALRGHPAHELDLWDEDAESATSRAIHVASIDSPAGARFCESVESGHSDQKGSARIARALGIESEPYRIDSQCKYAAVARNDASIYLRMPTRADYQEKIWDHAAGSLLVECAGGRVSDIEGRPLDFTHGRTLDANRGIVATGGRIHEAVIDAIRRVGAGAPAAPAARR